MPACHRDPCGAPPEVLMRIFASAAARFLLAALLVPAIGRADTPAGTPPVPVPATAADVLPDVSESLAGTPVPLETFTPVVVSAGAMVDTVWGIVCGLPYSNPWTLPYVPSCADRQVLFSVSSVPERVELVGGGRTFHVEGYEIYPMVNRLYLTGNGDGTPPASAPALRRTLAWRKVLQAVVDAERLDVEVPYLRGASVGDATELARSLGQPGLDWTALSTAVGNLLGTPVTLSGLRPVSRRFTSPVDSGSVLVLGAWQLVERLELVGAGDAPWSDPDTVTIPVPPVENRTGTVHLEMTAFPR
jgi:hypothetical protein